MPLFVPEPTPAGQIGLVRTATGPDGAELGVSVVSEHRDGTARTQTTLLRYERRLGSDHTVSERPWVLHWYPRDVFAELVAAAGLTVAAVTDPQGRPAPADATDVTYRLRPAA